MKKFLNISVKKRFFVLAIILRLLIMPFFFHPDIKVYHYQASFFKRGILNIYDYLDKNKDNLPIREQFVYFPLAYIFLGSYNALTSSLLGHDFLRWLSGGVFDAASSVYVFRYLFFLKLPNLFFDLMTGLVLLKLINDKKLKAYLFYLWFFNPFTLALIYIYSNIDIFPVFFTVLCLYFLKEKRNLWAGLSLVLGAGFKVYPILLLPVLFLTKDRITNQIKNFVLSILAFFAIIYPFWSRGFLYGSLSSGLTNRIFDFGFDIGLLRKIPYFVIVYLVYFTFLFFRRRRNFCFFFLAVTLSLVAFVDYHIQWLLWFIPFLFYFSVYSRGNFVFSFLIILVGLVSPLFLNDRFLTSSLLLPVSDFFDQASYPFIFVSNFVEVNSLRENFKILFIAISLFFLVMNFKFNYE